MKILVYNICDFGTPALETQADLIQQHLDHGDDVVHIACNIELPVCHFNPEHRITICALCCSRRKSCLRLTSRSVMTKSILNLSYEDRRQIAAFSFEANNLLQLKHVQFGPFDVGMAVASWLVSWVHDPEPDLASYQSQLRDWIRTSLAVYLSALNTLKQEQPDRVYLFNGRWAFHRAVLRACQVQAVDAYCYELGADMNKFILVKNRLPQDLEDYHANVSEAWRQADPMDRDAIGSTFFEEKAMGVERQMVVSYIADQTHGLLPAGWNSMKRNIAVFLGSEFEQAALGREYNYPFYANQNDGIARIVASLNALNAPVHLYIRIHPYMKGIRNRNMEELLALRSPVATVIPPESPVSSYALLHACEKTLTFGSSMGVEAIYWGKCSILAGRSYYEALGGTYNPPDHDELIRMLLEDLPPKPREGALMFGYFELTKGIEHTHYKPDSLYRGRFRGQYVDDAMPWCFRVILRITRSRLHRIVNAFGSFHRWLIRRRISD
jgi:hypothetical protein